MKTSGAAGNSQAGFVALIPARKESRGVPGKNLRELGGVPLLVRSVRTALAATEVRRVLVSTDGEELARLALSEGAEVPFLRPGELARDTTPMWDVVTHMWNFLEDQEAHLEGVILLQPTSPFRTAETIDRAVRELRSSSAAHLKGVRKVRDHPEWMLRLRDSLLVPYRSAPPPCRQDLAPLYVPCGAVYGYRREFLERPDLSAPSAWIEVEWPENLDVDTPEDFWLAERLCEEVAAV